MNRYRQLYFKNGSGSDVAGSSWVDVVWCGDGKPETEETAGNGDYFRRSDADNGWKENAFDGVGGSETHLVRKPYSSFFFPFHPLIRPCLRLLGVIEG